MSIRKFLFPSLIFASMGVQGQIISLKNPPTLAKPNGYSHFAEVDLGKGRMIIISGQVALDENGKLVGEGDVGKQALQIFENIKRIMQAAGGDMSNVIKLGYFIKDVRQIQAVRTARDQYINTQNPPTSTLVEVSNLFRPDVLIEIEATAIIPKK